jgi:hypothetical protein
MDQTQQQLLEQQAREQLARGTHTQNLNLSTHLLQKKKEEDHFSKLIESGIPKSSSRYLSILLNSDLVLSFMPDAAINENRWYFRIMKEVFLSVHPRPESVLSGRFRGYLFDDNDDELESLDGRAKLQIGEILAIVESRLLRSTNGWQQDQLAKSISQSIVSTKTEGAEDRGRRRLFG